MGGSLCHNQGKFTHSQDKTFVCLFPLFEYVSFKMEIKQSSLPPHSRGHTLDVLISMGVVILNVDVVDVALSDHFCVLFDLFVTP